MVLKIDQVKEFHLGLPKQKNKNLKKSDYLTYTLSIQVAGFRVYYRLNIKRIIITLNIPCCVLDRWRILDPYNGFI